MTRRKGQVFIATHSSYFIRSQHYDNLKYLIFDNKNNPVNIALETKDKNYYIAYPEIFFAEKILLVEGYPDKIFLERSLELLMREKGYPDLSTFNISIIATGSKHKFNKVSEFIRKNTKLTTIIICDLDFALKKKDYKFIGQDNIHKVEKLTEGLLLNDIFKDVKIFRQFGEKIALEFISFLDNTFKKTYISKSSKKRYEDYRVLFRSLRTAEKPELTFKKNRKLKSIHKIFVDNNVWLLKKGKIDTYVKSNLKISSKLSESKLQEEFYPDSLSNLKKYLTKDSIKELEEITEFIITKLVK